MADTFDVAADGDDGEASRNIIRGDDASTSSPDPPSTAHFSDGLTAADVAARLLFMAGASENLIGIADAHGEVKYLNPAARKRLGLDEQSLTNLTLDAVFTPRAHDRYYEEVRPALLTRRQWSGELPMYDASGEVIHVWQSIVAQVTAAGEIEWLATIGDDITERRERELELTHSATHEPMTGLPNRALLLDHIRMALARSAREATAVGVLFVDVDHFKTINDAFGHDAGDMVLIDVARRIESALRPSDTVARLGGDEFVVLCDGVDGEREMLMIAERVRSSVESPPISAGPASLTVRISGGITLSGPEYQEPEELVREADAAMYRAKEHGRGRIELFDTSIVRAADSADELSYQLAVGIGQGAITVDYQPIIELATGTVMGVEALARWRHSERGVLDASEFIDISEQTGVVVPLGLQVLREAWRQAARWRRAGGRDTRVHVNLSLRQLTDPSLPRVVRELIATTGLAPGQPYVEVPSRVLLEHPEQVETLRALNEAGARVVIDGLDADAVARGVLREALSDGLKIDRALVAALGERRGRAAVAAVIALAHSQGVPAIASGVETTRQLVELRALDCDAAQGYFFARPREADAIEPLLRRRFVG